MSVVFAKVLKNKIQILKIENDMIADMLSNKKLSPIVTE